MFLILLVYLLIASTFTLAKAILSYLDPIFFIALRMSVAGCLLLGYLALYNPKKLAFNKRDWPLFAQIVIFHIFCSYVFEFWSLQYINSSKACLLFNISPFLTALFSYFICGERLTLNKIIGLCIGFMGMMLMLTANSPLENLVGHIFFFSIPELVLLAAVASGAYGWIVMRQLLKKDYSYVMVNGFGMLVGGIIAFITSLILEGWPTFCASYQNRMIELLLSQVMNPYFTALCACILYATLLILIGNIIVYNLYGYLIKTHSPTFLSFAGFTTPLFAAALGWIFLGETISWQFLAASGLTFIGLYLFCRK